MHDKYVNSVVMKKSVCCESYVCQVPTQLFHREHKLQMHGGQTVEDNAKASGLRGQGQTFSRPTQVFLSSRLMLMLML